MLKAIRLVLVVLPVLLAISCRQMENADMKQVTSITMNLYYTGDGDNARLFMEEMESSGTANLIRNEEDNIRYDYFIPANDPHTVLLIDSWESQEALDRHHATPMMQTIAALREKYDLHMSAERYVQYQDEGVPSQDEKFLRR